MSKESRFHRENKARDVQLRTALASAYRAALTDEPPSAVFHVEQSLICIRDEVVRHNASPLITLDTRPFDALVRYLANSGVICAFEVAWLADNVLRPLSCGDPIAPAAMLRLDHYILTLSSSDFLWPRELEPGSLALLAYREGAR